MSYSMSPPHKPAPRPYSPYQNHAGSPTNLSPFVPPPAKRQRLSPDARSPQNGPPGYGGTPHGLPPVGPYGNPYAPAQSPYSPAGYAQSPQSSFNTPQSYIPPQQMQWQSQPSTSLSGGAGGQMSPAWSAQPSQTHSSQMMPPPPRPNKEDREERAGVDEIGDSLYGSGINLKDEENYMHATWNNRHGGDSFTTNQTTSFGSSTWSPNNSFNLLTQSTSFGSQSGPDGAFAGTMGPTRSQEEIEEEAKRERERAAHARAQARVHHQANPFLLGRLLFNRLDARARENGVQLNTAGLYRSDPSVTPQTHVMMNGEQGQGIVRTDYKIEASSEFEQVMSLLSLATGERVRGLVDEAFVLARARRYGDHGRVPPEYVDIAVGEGEKHDEEIVPENVTGTQWDQVPDANGKGDGVHEMPNGEAAKSSTTPLNPQPTISFSGRVNATLRALADRDRQAEKERVKKREARRRAAENDGEDGTTSASAASVPGVVDPETPADNAAPTTAAQKVSKKAAEQQKKDAARATEAISHTSTNQTAAMMALGKKGSKYSWMTGGMSQIPVNRFKAPTSGGGSGMATPQAAAPATAVKAEGGTQSAGGGGVAMGRGASGQGQSGGEGVGNGLEWGDWREDGVGGKGIQMRDWVWVLERDGREKRALQRACNALK